VITDRTVISELRSIGPAYIFPLFLILVFILATDLSFQAPVVFQTLDLPKNQEIQTFLFKYPLSFSILDSVTPPLHTIENNQHNNKYLS